MVDFNGNFVHLCHRVKEEAHLIPTLIEHELVQSDQLGLIHHEHARAKELTLGIRDGVQEGDWEKVLRLVVAYVHFRRVHMHAEEELFRLTHELPTAGAEALFCAFERVEADALGQSGRAPFVEVARRISGAD